MQMDMRTSGLVVAVLMQERLDDAARRRRLASLRPRRAGWFERFPLPDIASVRAALLIA
jgi:hypothetical protein